MFRPKNMMTTVAAVTALSRKNIADHPYALAKKLNGKPLVIAPTSEQKALRRDEKR